MKKIAVTLLLLVSLVATFSLVSAQGGLPGSGWTSGQQIQNVGGDDATVSFMAYDQSGTSTDCGMQSLQPGQSYTYLTDVDCPVSPGFIGSAVVSADQPIAAVVNVNNKGVGAASGQYRGTSGSDASTEIAFPLVKSDHAGRTTTFFLQNASTDVNTITATFNIGGTTYEKVFNSVPGNAMVVVIPADAGAPTGTGNVGGLTVTGTQPLAGAALEHPTVTVAAENLQGSKAFTPNEYDTTAYCPLLRNAFGGKQTTTGLQIQNVDNIAIDITVTYDYVGGGSSTATATGVLPGNSANFLQANDIPAGTLASGTIEATGTIAAIVNDKATASNPERVTTYACFSENGATPTISLPLVKEDFGGSVSNTTGIQIQNVGDSATIVTLVYRPTTGGSVSLSHTDAIQPGASKTFYRVANGGTTNLTGSPASLDSTVNGVTITADQPIVAIANESSLSGDIQDTKNYEGFNLSE